ncbi:MAG: hypothetical protein ABSA12_13600 [Verrucomicrobiia bacterium]|jgi:hypothetical protein
MRRGVAILLLAAADDTAWHLFSLSNELETGHTIHVKTVGKGE